MRHRRIATIEAANAYLDATYLAGLNHAYALDAADPADAHRPPDPAVRLDEVPCEQERRAVGNDWRVRWKDGSRRTAKEHEALDLAGNRVLVKHQRDGTLLLGHGAGG